MKHKFYTYMHGLARCYVAVNATGVIVFEAQQIDLIFTFDGEPGSMWNDIKSTVPEAKEIDYEHFSEKVGLFFSSVTGFILELKPKK